MGRNGRALALVCLGVFGCGGDSTTAPIPPVGAAPAGGDVLLDRDGTLEPSDARGARSRIDRYDVAIGAGEHVRVTLTSTAFDPVLEVTPPRGAPLTNDDVGGDRTRSEIEIVAPIAGQLKVQVESYVAEAEGAYHVHVERVRQAVAVAPPVAAVPPSRPHHFVGALAGAPPASPLHVGDRVTGSIDPGD